MNEMIPQFHSQFGEDRAIYPLFCQQEKGFYVDIGAYDGVLESNTYLFDRLGWKGVCVEPVSSTYMKLRINRPKAICLNVAVWDKSQQTCNFHVLEKRGWSRMEYLFHPEMDSPLEKIEHPYTYTLNHILRCHDVPINFDLLSIDVEGSEPRVLEGFTLTKYLPRIVIIESWHKSKSFDEYFNIHDAYDLQAYHPIYSWEQGVGGTNIIYCREPEDAEVVKRRWHT